MAYSNNRVCDHLSIGVCPCTSNDDSWSIKKVLTRSDTGRMRRLLLGKKLAEDFVLSVLGGNVEIGIRAEIWDIDTKSMHVLKFKRLSGSYIFTDGWLDEFVKRRDLKQGDKIGLYWDQYGRFFNFTVLQANQNILGLIIPKEEEE